MKKRILQPLLVLLLPVLLVLVIVQPCPAVEKTNISQNPRVLFLSSYSYEWESIPKQLAGIKDTLNGYARVDYIFMDTKRLSYDDVKKDVYEHVSAHMKMTSMITSLPATTPRCDSFWNTEKICLPVCLSFLKV